MKLPSVRSFEDRKLECLSLDNSMHTTLEGTDDITAECVGKIFIEAPNQRPGSTDCGAAVHEFGQRLVYWVSNWVLFGRKWAFAQDSPSKQDSAVYVWLRCKLSILLQVVFETHLYEIYEKLKNIFLLYLWTGIVSHLFGRSIFLRWQ